LLVGSNLERKGRSGNGWATSWNFAKRREGWGGWPRAGRGGGSDGFCLSLEEAFWRLTLTDSDRLVSDSWELLVKMGTAGRLLGFLRTEGEGWGGRPRAGRGGGTGRFCLPSREAFWRLTLTDSDGLVSAFWKMSVCHHYNTNRDIELSDISVNFVPLV